jgi:hypothetical protein
MRRRRSGRGRALVGSTTAHTSNDRRVPRWSTRRVPWPGWAGGSASAEGSHHLMSIDRIGLTGNGVVVLIRPALRATICGGRPRPANTSEAMREPASPPTRGDQAVYHHLMETAPDGSPVELYVRLGPVGEPKLISSALTLGQQYWSSDAGQGGSRMHWWGSVIQRPEWTSPRRCWRTSIAPCRSWPTSRA